jgi:hypothetical protein
MLYDHIRLPGFDKSSTAFSYHNLVELCYERYILMTRMADCETTSFPSNKEILDSLTLNQR